MFEKWMANGTATPFYIRKTFTIGKSVKSAEARVCGLGQFLFYLNGKKVDDHELDPAWTDYHKLIQYVVFDIRDYLQQGENVLGAEVGNGWYIKMDEHYTFSFPVFMPPNPNPYKPYGKCLVFAAELTITYEDGTMEIICADENCKTAKNPVVMSNVYGSETIDHRLEQPGWNTVGFDDSAWENALPVSTEDVPKGELKEQLLPPVKIIKRYEGQFMRTVMPDKDTTAREIYDFGQNMSGILDVKVCGKRGDMIRIYPAEKLDDHGDVDQVAKTWTKVDSCITCIIGKDYEWEHFRMKFTYFAGRYIAVEKVSSTADDHEIKINGIFADAISSAWKTDGHFSCDDKRYEQIYSLVERAVEANMVGVHTDCPTIERFAWQEPNHLMAGSIFYMKDGKRLWEKFLQDMRYAQHTKDDYFFDMAGEKFYPGDGLMPSQCPCYIPNVLPVPGMGSFYDIIPWGSTIILGAYWHYQFYGDVSILQDNYDAGMKYLNHLKTKVTKEEFISHGLGDWGNPRNELARENIETAFLYADAKVLAYFAEILGRTEDKETLESYAESVRKNYNDRLLIRHPEKGFWCYRCFDHPDEIFLTQAAQALPLFWGMVPEDKVADVTEAMKYTLERDGAFICGEVGLPYVIQTARKYGMNDMICRFILRKEHPSYYAFVLDGETTLGEYWEKNPRSHCHDMMGHIIEWYYNGIAGIQPVKPGFSEIVIRPYLPESMNEFTCSYESIRGLIRVHVERQGEKIVVRTKVPGNIISTIDTANLKGDCVICCEEK